MQTIETDPWVFEYLRARVREHVGAWQGREVIVHRFMQKPISGTLLRGDESRGMLMLTGSQVPVDQVERIEAA